MRCGFYQLLRIDQVFDDRILPLQNAGISLEAQRGQLRRVKVKISPNYGRKLRKLHWPKTQKYHNLCDILFFVCEIWATYSDNDVGQSHQKWMYRVFPSAYVWGWWILRICAAELIVTFVWKWWKHIFDILHGKYNFHIHDLVFGMHGRILTKFGKDTAILVMDKIRQTSW